MPDLVASGDDDRVGFLAPAEDCGLTGCVHGTKLSFTTPRLLDYTLLGLTKAFWADCAAPNARGTGKRLHENRHAGGRRVAKSLAMNNNFLPAERPVARGSGTRVP